MTCCLNPDCQQPQNPDDAEFCLNCGSKLTFALRGRYRITRPLGQGGFGRTFLAVDDDRLLARCVIKQFSPQVKGTKSLDKAIQLFQQEAERLNELGEHPQIPTLQAYFEHDERLYLVQQFIEGQTLLQELAQYGIFGERRIREVLAGVLPVLKFVHDHHVIHRDITPSNIIRRFSDNKLVLIDFGVSKLLSAETSSQPGTKIGTEGYAPMEQLRGGKAYPASDIYSLGATCIYLLTQTKPDDLYDPLEGRWLWRERLTQQGGTISDSIALILNKMLKDLVSERYQSADAVMRDLRMALSRPIGATSGTGGRIPNNPIPSTPSGRPAAPNSRPPTVSGQPRVSGSPAATPSGSGRPLSAPRGSNPLSGHPVSGSQGRRCLLTLTAHARWVTAVAISSDGKRVASGGLDDAIKIWNLDSGELLLTLKGHTKPVNCLAISPDCQILVSGSDDHSLKVWNLATGSLLQTLHGHSRDVNSVAIHPGGQLLASGADDRTARVWKLGTGEPLQVFSNLAGMIRAVAISPDGQLLASGGLDNQIKLWSLKTGTLASTFTKTHYSAVNAIAFALNGKTLISASKDKTIKVWDVSKGEVIRTLTGHTDSVNSIALSNNGKLLVSGSSDTTLKLWNVETGELKGTLAEHTSAVHSVSISPDGRRVASASSDTTVKIWQIV
ncbi:MAG: protein kinase [Leptolyngbyaceae cyanobacterium bins.302]|nr:protein kinase [Leptolyngbyaceae cyanobacterium bins.302]